MPHLLRILASDEPLGQQLCDVVSDIVYVPPMVPITAPSGLRTLQTSFWGDSAPNSLRLQLVLAQWGQRTFPNLTVEFSTAIAAIEAQLLGALARRALTWASTAAEEAVGPLDARYLGHLFEICAHTSGPVPEQSERLRALASDGAAGAACPACGSGVRSGGGNSVFCEKGHEWGESAECRSEADYQNAVPSRISSSRCRSTASARCVLPCRSFRPHSRRSAVPVRIRWFKLRSRLRSCVRRAEGAGRGRFE
jgi:hypothetical protein